MGTHFGLLDFRRSLPGPISEADERRGACTERVVLRQGYLKACVQNR